MATHTIYFPDLCPQGQTLPPGHTVTIDGEEAHHAWRVKRLDRGDHVRLVDAKGASCDATIANLHKRGREWVIELALGQTAIAPVASPIVHALVAPPKGDRLAEMIDQLSQVGASSFTPLLCQHAVVDPREAKLDRLHRIAIESLKQCGRSHALTIRPAISFRDVWQSPPAHAILADASGSPLHPPAAPVREVHLLIGPEGGFTRAEIDQAASHHCHIASLGVHVMRIETAAVVGVAMLMNPA